MRNPVQLADVFADIMNSHDSDTRVVGATR
jgi:hypothetical protein